MTAGNWCTDSAAALSPGWGGSDVCLTPLPHAPLWAWALLAQGGNWLGDTPRCLAPFSSLFHFPTLLLVFTGIASQINSLHLNPCLRVCFQTNLNQEKALLEKSQATHRWMKIQALNKGKGQETLGNIRYTAITNYWFICSGCPSWPPHLLDGAF